MRSFRWSKRGARPSKGQMLYMTKDEALFLAESILRQAWTGSTNDERAEFTMTDGSYFSAVVDDKRAKET